MLDGTNGAVVNTTGSPDNAGGKSNRKLCVRHKRMADEGANVAMQQVSLSLSLSAMTDATDR
jgi:hypothetical protein